MTTVGAFEAKTKLSALLELARVGHEFVITKRGAPIARIVPFYEVPQQPKEESKHG